MSNEIAGRKGDEASGTIEDKSIVHITYLGEERVIIPRELFFGVAGTFKHPQWLLRVHDVGKNGPRTFAMREISNWRAK